MKDRNHCYWQILLAGCGVFLLIFGTHAATNGIDVSHVEQESVILAPFLAVFEDPSRTLTLADVQSPEMAAHFTVDPASGNALGFGYTRSAYWLRLQLRNSGDQPVERMLELDYARYTYVDFYQPNLDGSYRSIRTGILRPFATRAYPNRVFVFPLTLPPYSESIIFLRLESISRLFIPARLWSPQAFFIHVRNDYLGHAWYFGIATAMVIYNLLLFLALWERAYLFYVAFVGCVAFALAAYYRFIDEFIQINSRTWSLVLMPTGFIFAVTMFLLFVRRMLNTSVTMAGFDPILKFWMGICLICPFIFALAPAELMLPVATINLTTVILLMGVIIYGAFQRQRSAYYFIVAYGVLFISSLLFALPTTGIAYSWLMEIGSGIEMLVLAFALADRVQVLKQDRERALHEKTAAQQLMLDHLRQSEKMLEERVQQRTAELQKSNMLLTTTLDDLQLIQDRLIQSEREAVRDKEIATAALHQQRQFVAMASHEFRSPLAIIDSAAQLLTVKFPKENQATSTLQKIRQAVSRLSGFLENCLTQDRFEAGQLSLHPALINVSALVESVTDGHSLRIESHRIILDMGPNLPAWWADPALLRILLLNLLDNAVKYSPPGSEIRLCIQHDDATYRIDVIDQGRGIPDHELPFMLDKYRRGAGTASIPGAGLGLALVARIVSLHGGRIDIASQEGVGTTFHLEFPTTTQECRHGDPC